VKEDKLVFNKISRNPTFFLCFCQEKVDFHTLFHYSADRKFFASEAVEPNGNALSSYQLLSNW
jgi:hypothetical protein